MNAAQDIHWCQDDVRTALVEYRHTAWTAEHTVQLFGCYGIGVIGDQKTAEVYLVALDKEANSVQRPWYSLVRVKAQSMSTAEKQKTVDLMTDIAAELVVKKQAGWNIQTGEKHSMPLAAIDLEMVCPSTDQSVYQVNRRMRFKKSFFKQLQETLHQLQHLQVKDETFENQLQGIVTKQQLSVPQLLLALDPNLDGEKLIEVSAKAQNVLQTDHSYVSQIHLLQELLSQPTQLTLDQ